MVDFSPVTKKDLAAIIDIYNYYILNSTASFHSEKLKKKRIWKKLSQSLTRYTPRF